MNAYVCMLALLRPSLFNLTLHRQALCRASQASAVPIHSSWERVFPPGHFAVELDRITVGMCYV